ncbi:MAG: MFS transporter [Gaiellales bacterium]
MSERMTAGDLLRDRAVAPLLGIETLQWLGMGVWTTALGWQAYARSGEPLVLGLLGLAEFVPAALLALPTGHLADRHDRRRITAWGMLAMTAVMLILAADAAAGDSAVWPLYVLAFAAGTANAFVNPAVSPLLAGAVPAESLSRAVAMSTSGSQAAMVAGPAVAGLLQSLGNPAPYLLGAACSAVSAGLAVAIPKSLGRSHVEEQEATLADALGGVRFIRSVPALFGAISLDLMAVLFGGATALMPIFARDILHVGALGNGILRSASAVGALTVGLVLTAKPLRRRVGLTLFLAVATFGAATVVFGLSRSFTLSLIALAVLAGADMISMLLRATLVPLLTPPPLRGRVTAVERVFIGASNELGAFESGVAAALIGAVPAVVLGGLASIAVAAIWAWRFPSLRHVDRFDQLSAAEPPARPGTLGSQTAGE